MNITLDDFKTCKTKGCKCETALELGKCIYCMSAAERRGSMEVTNYLVRRSHLPFNNNLYELMKRTKYGIGAPFIADITPKLFENDHANCEVLPVPKRKLTPYPERGAMPTPSAKRLKTSIIIPAEFVRSWNKMEFMSIDPKQVIYSSSDFSLISVDLTTYEHSNPIKFPPKSDLHLTTYEHRNPIKFPPKSDLHLNTYEHRNPIKFPPKRERNPIKFPPKSGLGRSYRCSSAK